VPGLSAKAVECFCTVMPRMKQIEEDHVRIRGLGPTATIPPIRYLCIYAFDKHRVQAQVPVDQRTRQSSYKKHLPF
jgi:hypothetical protein